jgi:hypothetical protein
MGTTVPEPRENIVVYYHLTKNVKYNAGQFGSHANQRLAGEELGDCRADAV